MAHFTDLLITINYEDYNRAQKFKLKENGRVQLIHGVGVDTSRFCGKTKSNIRNELGINKSSIVYISVGEMIDRKNQMRLIQAFENAKIESSHLLLCGDGGLRKQIENYVVEHKLSNIHLLGFRSDIPELLAESDIFVFPSYQEGLPGALMEAMASGKACVASKIRGNVDLLGDDYKYLFNPDNTEELSNMLKAVIPDIHKCETVGQERIKPYGFKAAVKE